MWRGVAVGFPWADDRPICLGERLPGEGVGALLEAGRVRRRALGRQDADRSPGRARSTSRRGPPRSGACAVGRCPQASAAWRRLPGLETRTFRVRAALVAMKLEDDSDIHLVIADPRDRRLTMIVEFPNASCTRGASRQARAKMRSARNHLVAACGSPDVVLHEPLGESDHLRCRLLRPAARTDRRCAERHRAPSRGRSHAVDVSKGWRRTAAAAARPTSTAAKWKLSPVLSDGLHSHRRPQI